MLSVAKVYFEKKQKKIFLSFSVNSGIKLTKSNLYRVKWHIKFKHSLGELRPRVLGKYLRQESPVEAEITTVALFLRSALMLTT